MSYSVEIERIGADGYPHGQASVETIASESEAIAVLRRSVAIGQMVKEQMRLSIYAPGSRLLMTYTTGTSEERAVGAAL